MSFYSISIPVRALIPSAVVIDPPHHSLELNVCKKIKITEFDRDNFKITAKGYGETYDREKHTPGTEIKAITYSAMQILEKEGRTDVYTIVDI